MAHSPYTASQNAPNSSGVGSDPKDSLKEDFSLKEVPTAPLTDQKPRWLPTVSQRGFFTLNRFFHFLSVHN